MATVGEDMAQPGEGVPDRGQHSWRAVAILHISAMDHRADEKAVGVGDDVAFAALDLLTRVIA